MLKKIVLLTTTVNIMFHNQVDQEEPVQETEAEA